MAGDQLARVALTVLVYDRTRSSLLAAVTFVASIVPMFIGGLALGGLADRFPRRTVMIVCDVLRCALVALMVVPGIPVWGLVALLFLVTLINAPFLAARQALVPDILDGELYVLGRTITQTTAQFAQVVGFGAGGAVVGLLGTGMSLVADAATFAFSALVVGLWVRSRPVPREEPERETETAGRRGALRLVITTPALLLPMLFGWVAAFYNAPEGIAAPLAASLGGGAATVGAILAAQVLGEALGMTLYGRLVPPDSRRRLMGPLAMATCAVLVLFALPSSLAVTLLVLFLSGLFGCYQIEASSAFVRALPRHVRGTAFGLAQGGMSLGQGIVMMAAGALGGTFAPTAVIAALGITGTVCAFVLSINWARASRTSRGGDSAARP